MPATKPTPDLLAPIRRLIERSFPLDHDGPVPSAEAILGHAVNVMRGIPPKAREEAIVWLSGGEGGSPPADMGPLTYRAFVWQAAVATVHWEEESPEEWEDHRDYPAHVEFWRAGAIGLLERYQPYTSFMIPWVSLWQLEAEDLDAEITAYCAAHPIDSNDTTPLPPLPPLNPERTWFDIYRER